MPSQRLGARPPDRMLHLEVTLGQEVTAGQRLGALYDSYGRRLALVKADRDGIVMGRTEAPMVNHGDALVHLGEIGETSGD